MPKAVGKAMGGVRANGMAVAGLGASRLAAVRPPVLDQVLDGGDGDVVALREELEGRHPRHGAVVLHDLADDRGGAQAGEARQVHGGLRLPGAGEHAPRLGPEREDVARLHQVLGDGGGVRQDLDGARAVVGRDAGGDPLPRLDGDGEAGAEGGGVAVRGDHHGQGQAVQVLPLHRGADQAARAPRHEGDGLGGDRLGRHGQIPFVLPVLRVDEDHETAFGEGPHRLANGDSRHR